MLTSIVRIVPFLLILLACNKEKPKSDTTIKTQVEELSSPEVSLEDSLNSAVLSIDSLLCDDYICRPYLMDDLDQPLVNDYIKLVQSLDTLQQRLDRLDSGRDELLLLYQSIIAKRDSIKQLKAKMEAGIKRIENHE